jgi:hypothetical protein
MGPTQPPVQWLLGLSRGDKSGRGVTLTPSPPSSAVVMKEWSYTSTPSMGRTACTEPQCLYKGGPYLFFFYCIQCTHKFVYLTYLLDALSKEIFNFFFIFINFVN